MYQEKLRPYVQLMRLDKPIGSLLLFWPTLQAILLASHGHPKNPVLWGFAAGTVLMRSAGCVVNDMADKEFDKLVKRTMNRPLANGRLSRRQALPVLILLLGLSAALLLLYDQKTLIWSIPALLLALIYPLMKRYTYFPQVVLGAAFSWSIPMASVASHQSPNLSTALLFMASLAWVMAYDTQYAMVDRDDDIKIGVKSTAIFFGTHDLLLICIFQLLYLAGLTLVAALNNFSPIFYLFPALAILFFANQYRLCRYRQREACFQAFLQNNRVGILMSIGFIFGIQ